MQSLPFWFTTGIENSYPTIEGGKRIDQMAKCGHYDRWREDFDLVRELGLDALRYGPAYYQIHTAPGRFDFSSADEPMEALRTSGVEVIADLCHFGVPDWLGGFQDPAFPILFAEYARTFARRYPWVRSYTPVNEIFVCANFSALQGWWNEQEKSIPTFLRAVRNLAMAHELAVEAILEVRPDALIIQGESMEHFHAESPEAQEHAALMNGLKFLALDLTTGRPLSARMADLLIENGIATNDLTFFREQRAVGQRWIGLDYYASCEHLVSGDRSSRPHATPRGFADLATEYYRRYQMPLFHCETNRTSDEAVSWLDLQWGEILQLRARGVPVTGFTWYSLTDQIDWQHALRIERNDLHSVGLYDLDRQIRPVGERYRALVQHDRAAQMEAV